MPKRKRESEYEYNIRKKIKRLENKLHHGKRSRRRHYYESDDSPSPRASHRSLTESQGLETENEELWIDNDEYAVDIIDPSPPVSTHRPNSVVVDTSKTIQENSLSPPPIGTTSMNVANLETNNIEATATVKASTSATETMAPKTSTEGLATETAAPASKDTGLDKDLLEIRGKDPTTEKEYGADINQKLSVRLEHYATAGLSKEERKELIEKYLTPGNCKLIDPPELNPETKAAVTEILAKRDKAIFNKQKTLTSAITCIGKAITMLLSSKEKDMSLLKLLMDASRLTCECQHTESMQRRYYVLSTLKKDMKDQLINTKIDKLLFSENLAETLKSAKAIHKSGADLKQSTPSGPAKKPTSKTLNNSKNLNWRNAPARRPPAPVRKKEPATTSTQYRPAPSYKTSFHLQHRPNHSRR